MPGCVRVDDLLNVDAALIKEIGVLNFLKAFLSARAHLAKL